MIADVLNREKKQNMMLRRLALKKLRFWRSRYIGEEKASATRRYTSDSRQKKEQTSIAHKVILETDGEKNGIS